MFRSLLMVSALFAVAALGQVALADGGDPCVVSGTQEFKDGATLFCQGTMTIKKDARLSAPAGEMISIVAGSGIVFEDGSELNFEGSYLYIRADNATGVLNARGAMVTLVYGATSSYEQKVRLNEFGAAEMTVNGQRIALEGDDHTPKYE